MSLTDTSIRAAKSKDKPYKLYDDDGLFLLIAASGSKLWRLKYRFGGQEKLLALGRYGVGSYAKTPSFRGRRQGSLIRAR